MADLGKILSLLGTIFLVSTLVFNIVPKLPKFPWDIYINKAGLRIYIPIISTLVLSAILTLIFNFFRN